MSKSISGLFKWTIGHIRFNGGRIPGKDGVVTGGDSQKLKGNLMKTMGLPKHTRMKTYQAQHIIPAEMKSHPVIRKMGMNLDDASNGILLPTPKENVSALSRHRGYHSVYSEFVRRKLDKINPNQSSQALQKEVLTLQKNLRKLQESGLPLYKGYSDNDGKSRIYPNRTGNTVEMWERQYDALLSRR